jgi:hypothetical protein
MSDAAPRKLGRKPIARELKRVHRISVRLATREVERLYESAHDSGVKLSRWIRDRAIEASEKRRNPRNPCGG